MKRFNFRGFYCLFLVVIGDGYVSKKWNGCECVCVYFSSSNLNLELADIINFLKSYLTRPKLCMDIYAALDLPILVQIGMLYFPSSFFPVECGQGHETYWPTPAHTGSPQLELRIFIQSNRQFALKQLVLMALKLACNVRLPWSNWISSSPRASSVFCAASAVGTEGSKILPGGSGSKSLMISLKRRISSFKKYFNWLPV